MNAYRKSIAALALGLLTATTAHAEVLDADIEEYDPMICGSLKNPFGPFDYRTSPQDRRTLVESFHYDLAMEKIRSGEARRQSPYVWGDLDYTLRAFPNHPGSLKAIDDFSWDLKVEKPPGKFKTARCYFLRAVTFQPDDGTVRLLFGLYLLRRNEPKRAIDQLQLAEKLSPEDSNVQYNLGLAYFRLKDYPRALACAHKAYRLGFPLAGLKRMLQKEGQWTDPPPEEAAPAEKK